MDRLPDRDLLPREGADDLDLHPRAAVRERIALAVRVGLVHRLALAFGEWVRRPGRPRAGDHCHHNYTERERHFGQDVWLSRKGAIDASEGTWG